MVCSVWFSDYCKIYCKAVCALMYKKLKETEGNSMFCGSETADVHQTSTVEGLQNTGFPRSQSISILLYTKSQRNEKIKRTSYENT